MKKSLERIITRLFYDPETGTSSSTDLSVVSAIVSRLELDLDKRSILIAALHDLKLRSIGASTKGLFPSGDQILDHIADIQRLAEGVTKLGSDKELHFYAVSSVLDFRDADTASSFPLQDEDVWNWLVQSKNIAAMCQVARVRSDEIISFQKKMMEPYLGQEQLVGSCLPHLYEKITRKKFGISKSDNKPNATGGALFVMECVQALGLEPVTPNNVERHWKAARKKPQGDLGT